MRTCKWCGGVLGRDCYNEYDCGAVTQSTQQQQQQDPPIRWIKSSEQNPPFDMQVLCYCKIYGRYIGSYIQVIGVYGNWSNGKEMGILPPIYWMPLPPAPNEEIDLDDLPF